MGARFRMAEEGADALVQLGTNDVFKFASLIVGLRVVDGKRILEEAFRQAVAPNDAARAPTTGGREAHFAISQLH